MKNSLVITLLLAMFFLDAMKAEAANRYVRTSATGANNGTDWTNAYISLPSSLTRGDTYYVADGTYSSHTFNDPTSGTKVITIKKATVAEHGTETGWSDAYGDGQAVFLNVIAFASSYYVFDGNGTHKIPSNNPSDYGFKINSNTSDNWAGIVQFGTASQAVSHVTLRYTHVYNTTSGITNSGTVSLRFYPSQTNSHIKIQNSYIQNCGKDGIQITRSDYILVERSYIERLGRLFSGNPDNHGQTVTLTVANDNIVFRWNIWDANEGQALISWGDVGLTWTNLRFYGNVVLASEATPGFNSSGGLIGDAWGGTMNNMAIYNNTIVDQKTGHVHFPRHVATTLINVYGYNNIFYGNLESSSFPGATGYGYNASGGGGTAGGTNEQTGLSSSIFLNYAGHDYRLASPTAPGLKLTGQSWWNDTPDAFFGQLDYDTDMYGKLRGADGIWDRGAYEFVGGVVGLPHPVAPSNIRVQ
jgi:hypothetical protein